jgi:hypothetical protein
MAKYPIMTAPKGSLLHNDDSHGFTDPNQGGGPLSDGSASSTPANKRGGFGHPGRGGAKTIRRGGGRATAPNPASRGGTIKSFPSETRNPNRGGAVTSGKGNVRPPARGGFTHSGQQGVPSARHANPPLKAGNTGGRSYKLIAGRFKRAAMGAKPTGSSGKYGAPPVTTNT